jgi:hypothetical protein
MTYNGFSAIFGGVDLKLPAISSTLLRGGTAHERRKDAVRTTDGLPALEHIRSDRGTLSHLIHGVIWYPEHIPTYRYNNKYGHASPPLAEPRFRTYLAGVRG